MAVVGQLYLKLMTGFKKYGSLVVGTGFLILGLLASFRLFPGDLSEIQGIGFAIAGVLFMMYYFLRKRK